MLFKDMLESPKISVLCWLRKWKTSTQKRLNPSVQDWASTTKCDQAPTLNKDHLLCLNNTWLASDNLQVWKESLQNSIHEILQLHLIHLVLSLLRTQMNLKKVKGWIWISTNAKLVIWFTNIARGSQVWCKSSCKEECLSEMSTSKTFREKRNKTWLIKKFMNLKKTWMKLRILWTLYKK